MTREELLELIAEVHRHQSELNDVEIKSENILKEFVMTKLSM